MSKPFNCTPEQAGITPSASSGMWYDRLQILKFKNIYNYQMCLLMYKAFHSQLPNDIQTRFLIHNTVHNTGQSHLNFKLVGRSTKIQNRRPSVAGPYLWNALLPSTKILPNLMTFKKHLKLLSLT